jgi:hypothetical protein
MSKKTGKIMRCTICKTEKYIQRTRMPTFKYCSRKCKGIANAKIMLGNQRATGQGPNGGSFKAGLIPWNKGLKGCMGPNSTSFMVGNINKTKLPIGSITVRKDKSGKLRNWIRTLTGWKPYAQYVWETQNGPVPNGMILHHKDYDSLHDVIENLKLVSRSEHALIHDFPGIGRNSKHKA